MAETTIQWCDFTFNPWRGCTKVSAGRASCYAETGSKRNPKVLGVWGPSGSRVAAAESYWKQPLKWDREAKVAGVRRKVFCASLADVFEEWDGPVRDSNDTDLCICHGCGRWRYYVSYCEADCQESRIPRRLTLDDCRVRLVKLINETPNLDWLLLTKRPENIVRMLGKIGQQLDHYEALDASVALANRVWLGTSVEDQKTADERIPQLLKVAAKVRFLSCEPLLSHVDLSRFVCDYCGGSKTITQEHDFCLEEIGCPRCMGNQIDWTIVGGESGPKARPCRIEWISSIVQQCKAAGIPCFAKQLGSNVFCRNDEVAEWLDYCGHLDCIAERPRFQGEPEHIVGFLDKKGGNPDEWPRDLGVREFPKV